MKLISIVCYGLGICGLLSLAVWALYCTFDTNHKVTDLHEKFFGKEDKQ